MFGEERQVSVCREISKMYEESVRGTLAEVAEHFRQTEPKGEIVVVLQGIDADILKERKKAEKKAARKGWNVESLE